MASLAAELLPLEETTLGSYRLRCEQQLLRRRLRLLPSLLLQLRKD